MLKIKLASLSIAGVVMRFYFAMLMAFIFGFMGQWILAAFAAGTVAATAIMGMSISLGNNKNATTTAGRIVQLDLGEVKTRKAS